jgi:flavodoxin
MSSSLARSKLNNLQNTMMQFSSTSGAIHDIIISDPISMRAKLQGGLNLWDEIKRINIIFYQDGMRLYLDKTYDPVLQNRPLGENYASRSDAYGVFDPNAMNAINRIDPNAMNRIDPNAMNAINRIDPNAMNRIDPNAMNAMNAMSAMNESVMDAIQRNDPNAIQRNYPTAMRGRNPSQDIKPTYDIEYEYINPYNKLLDHVPTIGLAENNEDYAMTMFISDSLRPQGYEYFNDMGDNYNILENRTDWPKKDGREKYTKAKQTDIKHFKEKQAEVEHNTVYDDYSDFNMANYEYSDDGIIDTSTRGRENLPSTYIPFWQKLTREGADTDITGTLGFGLKESDTQIRGWNMDALRAKNGENFDRFYGARNGNYN